MSWIILASTIGLICLIFGASYGYFFGHANGSNKVCSTVNKASYWDGKACVVKKVVNIKGFESETPATK